MLFKKKLILVFIIFSCLSNVSIGQEFGDTLYVIAYNGVNLRSAPNTNSEKIKSIPFGTALMYCSDSYNDRIEVRAGRWIEVEYKQESCYVFDGFLIDKKPPASRKLTLTGLDEFIKKAYGQDLIEEVVEESKKKGDRPDIKMSNYSTGLMVTHLDYTSMESWEYVFPKMRSRDLINLIDLVFSNYNKENKTLVNFFEEDSFWKNKHPNEICARAFHVDLAKGVSVHFNYSRRQSRGDPVPRITVREIRN